MAKQDGVRHHTMKIWNSAYGRHRLAHNGRAVPQSLVHMVQVIPCRTLLHLVFHNKQGGFLSARRVQLDSLHLARSFDRQALSGR